MGNLICTTTDKKLMYNVSAGGKAEQFIDSIGAEFVVQDIIQYEQTRDDSLAVCTNLVSTDGKVYQTLSPIVNEAVQRLVEVFDIKNEEVRIRIGKEQSKGKRDYLTLEVI